MPRKNVLITLAIVLIGAGVVAANLYFRRDKGLTVTTDTIKSRDLEAVLLQQRGRPSRSSCFVRPTSHGCPRPAETQRSPNSRPGTRIIRSCGRCRCTI